MGNLLRTSNWLPLPCRLCGFIWGLMGVEEGVEQSVYERLEVGVEGNARSDVSRDVECCPVFGVESSSRA